MWGQANSAADVTGVSAGLAPTMMGPLSTVIAVAELARPAVPAVLNVHDRAVYVDNINDPPSGYVLARRWMRNDPDTDVESLSLPTNSLMLPRPLPVSEATAAADEAPVFPDDSEDYDPEEAVKALKRHWVSVRRYDTDQRFKNLERYRDRLKAITSAGVNPMNATTVQHLLAQQHQQQQQIQQQMQQQSLQALQSSATAAAAALGQGQPAVSQQQQQQQQQALPVGMAPAMMQPAVNLVQQQEQQQATPPLQGVAALQHEQAQQAAVTAFLPEDDAAGLGDGTGQATEAPVPEQRQQQQLLQQQHEPAAVANVEQMEAGATAFGA